MRRAGVLQRSLRLCPARQRMCVRAELLLRVCADFLQRLERRVELGLRTRDDGDVCAALGELLCQREAEPGAAAGDVAVLSTDLRLAWGVR